MLTLGMWVELPEKSTSMSARYDSTFSHFLVSMRTYFGSSLELTTVLNKRLNLQEVVRRGIAMEKATNELISLIKEHGRWVDPEATEN